MRVDECIPNGNNESLDPSTHVVSDTMMVLIPGTELMKNYDNGIFLVGEVHFLDWRAVFIRHIIIVDLNVLMLGKKINTWFPSPRFSRWWLWTQAINSYKVTFLLIPLFLLEAKTPLSPEPTVFPNTLYGWNRLVDIGSVSAWEEQEIPLTVSIGEGLDGIDYPQVFFL